MINRKLYKVGSLAAVSVLCMGLAGCASDGTSGDDDGVVYSWPLGTSSPEDTVTQVYAEKFAEEVLKLSDGEIEINIFPNSTVGNDSELLESCEEGDIPFVVQNTAPQVSYMEEMREASSEVYEEIRNSVGDELVDMYISAAE